MLIPLHRGGVVVAHALVDDDDETSVLAYRWRLSPQGYAVRGGRARPMHRDVCGLVPGDGLEVDHRNHDRLDNRRENLRVVTRAQNAQNRQRGYGTSSLRGASFDRKRGRWLAAHTLNQKFHYLGHFDTESEAGAAAAAFRREYMPFSIESEAA